MAEQNLVRRECDYCKDRMDFQQNRSVDQVSPEEAERVASWITLVRVHLIKQRNQLFPVTKHACKDSCARNIIELGMLDLPQEIKDALAEEKRQMELQQRKFEEAIAKAGANAEGQLGPVAVQEPGQA